MKYAIILPDGAADEPVPALDGRTPLDAAQIPNIDWIAENGRQGLVRTVPDGMTPGSEVATLSLLGYDPQRCPFGRAPLEAAARDIRCGTNDLIFRCNLVTIVDGRMADFAAGHIGQVEASALIDHLNAQFGDATLRFHAGVSYRNLMTLAGAGGLDVRCALPHSIPDEPVAKHAPCGPGAERIVAVERRAAELLRDHEINQVRRDLGENPANAIWLWGQGVPCVFEPFAQRFGLRGAVVAAVDLIRGIAVSLGLDVLDVPGATGYLDTNYRGKGEAAVRALDDHDLVVVHIEAPDEAGHSGNASAKVAALEHIDQWIVAPLLNHLHGLPEWRILIAPDHPTPVAKRVHTSDPPPFCMAGTNVSPGHGIPFSEANAAAAGLCVDPGYELIEYFLRV